MNKKQKKHKSIVSGNALAVSVVDKDIAFALKTFKRKMKQLGPIQHIKENRTFTKPSVKKRAEKIKAKYIQKVKDIHQYD